MNFHVEKVTKNLKYMVYHPYVVFFFIGLIFGLFQVFAVPAFGEPDEGAHLNRIYQISEGHVFGQIIPHGKGTYISKSLSNFEHSNDQLLFTPNSRTTIGNVLNGVFKKGPTINQAAGSIPVHFENTELYNPIGYTPQIVAMLASKLLDFSDNTTFYMIRFFGLIAWLAICAWAIKKMGTIGWSAVVLLLTPLSLQMASSVSADGMAIAASVLFMGIFIELFRSEKPLTKKHLVLLLLSIVLLACVKLPYIALAALLLILPNSLFNKKSVISKKYLIASAAVITLVIAGGWTLSTQKNYVSYRSAVGGIPIVQKTQEEYIFEHPASFAHKIYETYLRDTPYNGSPTLGYAGELGLLNYGISSWAIVLYFILLGTVFASLRNGASAIEYIGKFKQIYSLLIAILIFLLINVLIFISWSRINYPVIEGIQSRYFIPAILPIILMLLPILKKDIKLSRTFYNTIPTCLILVQVAGVIAVYYQFYAPPLPPV